MKNYRSSDYAVLLVNFGSPRGLSRRSVASYLYNILSEHLPSKLLAALWTVARTPQLVFRYKSIWTTKGSAFHLHSQRLVESLSSQVSFPIRMGMCYGEPSIGQKITELGNLGVRHLYVVPLFPHPSSDLRRLIHMHVGEGANLTKMNITYVDSLANRPFLLSAWSRLLQKSHPQHFDHVLMSFHSIFDTCEKETLSYKNACMETAQLLATATGIPNRSFSVCFQSGSRYGKWVGPFTRDLIDKILVEGNSKILIMSPSFLVDCLETLWEIDIEYTRFVHPRGTLTRVPSLNAEAAWVSEFSSFLEQLCGR